MRLLPGLLTGVAVAVAVLALLGVPIPWPRLGDRVDRPRLFGHFEAEGVPVPRAIGVSAAAGGATFVVIWAATTSLLIALVPALVIGGLPSTFYSARGKRREKQQRAAWPDALRSLNGSLQAGRSLHEALLDSETTGPAPLRGVFARYHDLTSLAVPEAEALAVVRDELEDPVADRVFEVLIVASQKGSNIALRVLNELADTVTADVQLIEKVETANTEQRLQSWAVFVVPWLTLVLVTAQPGDYRDYYATGEGVTVLMVGSVMSIGGMLVVKALARGKREPRVLLSAVGEEQR